MLRVEIDRLREHLHDAEILQLLNCLMWMFLRANSEYGSIDATYFQLAGSRETPTLTEFSLCQTSWLERTRM